MRRSMQCTHTADTRTAAGAATSHLPNIGAHIADARAATGATANCADSPGVREDVPV